jgi:hypothetical protein
MSTKAAGPLLAGALVLAASSARGDTSPPAPSGSESPTSPDGAAVAPPSAPMPAAVGTGAATAETSGPPPQSPTEHAPAHEPPVSLATRHEEAAAAPSSWFARPPLAVSAGQGDSRWQLTLYGFVEADAINDSTRSYSDSIGNALVARDETYAGRVGRTQFSIRNTRLGLALESPLIGGVKPSAIVETDFFGNQPPDISRAAYFDSPSLRLRQAYLKLEDDVVDVWVGQTYYLFGWQNYFFPASLEFLGLPNQAFGRTMQVRLGHTLKTDAVNVDVAVAAVSPAQVDSEVPDGNAGLRLSFNNWKGMSTPGNGGTTALPLSIGISGTARQFKVAAFAPPPTQRSNSATGWGLSIDALVPIIPARDAGDRGNRLTLTGSFVVGTGIGDLVNAEGGASFPTLPNPALANPPPLYTPNIDDGIVTFDSTGVLHTIDWQTFMIGLQYYLPPRGRVILSANVTEGYSKNMAQLFPRGGSEIELLSRVAKLSRYADANVFWDVTPAVRVGASFQYTTTEYVDGEIPRNLRTMAQALYFF